MDESFMLLATAKRISIPLNLSKKASRRPIVCDLKSLNPDLKFELPCINYSRFNGKPYKYLYGTNYFNE